METKRAILAIERILTNKPQNASRIIERLEGEYGIKAERKLRYDSVAVLTEFMMIEKIEKDISHNRKENKNEY